MYVRYDGVLLGVWWDYLGSEQDMIRSMGKMLCWFGWHKFELVQDLNKTTGLGGYYHWCSRCEYAERTAVI